jgi:hypothetical protein
MKTEILDIAELELDEAFKYYEDIYQGLGKRFIEEFESTLHRVKINPMAWQRSGKYTHRCLLNRFPYSIVYQVRPETILIIAVSCNHQKPNYWIERIEN